jgi:hypothetical protein
MCTDVVWLEMFTGLVRSIQCIQSHSTLLTKQSNVSICQTNVSPTYGATFLMWSVVSSTLSYFYCFQYVLIFNEIKVALQFSYHHRSILLLCMLKSNMKSSLLYNFLTVTLQKTLLCILKSNTTGAACRHAYAS